MRTDLFDFDLPADRIALRPASPRDAAKLLVVRPQQFPLTRAQAGVQSEPAGIVQNGSWVLIFLAWSGA
jgi:S-adenosylmethionine:tRNA ribosyltransferase-isomerase